MTKSRVLLLAVLCALLLCPSAHAQNRLNVEGESELLSPSLGVGINYVPWDLGFSIVPNFYRLTGGDDDAKVTVFSLTKMFKW